MFSRRASARTDTASTPVILLFTWCVCAFLRAALVCAHVQTGYTFWDSTLDVSGCRQVLSMTQVARLSACGLYVVASRVVMCGALRCDDASMGLACSLDTRVCSLVVSSR